MTNKEIAQEILKQLGGHRRLFAMIGAHQIAFDGPSLQFKFKAGRTHNFCKVKLNSMDTYDMEISKVIMSRETYEFKTINKTEFKGIYCDQLKELFQETTGLALTL